MLRDEDEPMRGCCRCCHAGGRRSCSRARLGEELKRRLPISHWLPVYSLTDLQGDVIAGLTIALTIIPQSIAYASGIADLPPQHGLYTSIVGPLSYSILGTSRDTSFGPTAVMSLLTAKYGAGFSHGDASVAAALALITGCVQLLLGLLFIGATVARFISKPVISAFTTVAGITIIASQLKGLLGLNNVPHDFIPELINIASRLNETNMWDVDMGVSCMLVLFGLKLLRDLNIVIRAMAPPSSSADVNSNSNDVETRTGVKYKLVVGKVLWVIGTARNVIVVSLSIVVVKILEMHGFSLFTLSPPVPPGLPPFQPPTFSQGTATPADYFKRMELGIAIVPLICIVENIVISKEFARKNGYEVDQNQEVIAIGITNVFGSFIGAYPAAASFSRSSLLSQSGVRTCLAGLFTGSVVLLALGLITSVFAYIPSSALSAVVIMACWDLLHFGIVVELWRENKLDVVPWTATLVVGLAAGVEYGLAAGIGITFILLAYTSCQQRYSRTDAYQPLTGNVSDDEEAERPASTPSLQSIP